MRFLSATAALALAFGALFVTPASASQTIQFTFFWTSHEFTFTDKTVTVTVINNITNKIGGNGEVIDTYRITLGDQVIEVTEKHDARDYVFTITGTQTIKLEGIDRGFWAGQWGPIMTITETQPEETQTQTTESPTLEPAEEASESPSPSLEPSPVEQPSQVEPTAPAASEAETKERGSNVLDDYASFLASNGIDEADYAHNLAIVRWYQIKASYDQAMAESKRGKAFIFAMQLEGQLRTIKSLYANGSLKPRVTQEPATPEPSPEPQTSSPEPSVPTPSPTPPVETTPATSSPVSPIPSVPEVQPSIEPQPQLPVAPAPTTPAQTPRPVEPVEVTQSPVAQTESSEVDSESPSISETVTEEPETTKSDSVSAAIPASPQEAIGAVISLFATAGLDMTPEQREKAQGVVVPSVIAAQVATLAMRRIK